MAWRYIIPLAATALPVVALPLLPGFWASVLLFLLLAAAALAWWDFFQADHTLRRNYPLIARVRWIAEDLRPFAQSYFVQGDLEGRPFSHQERALVYARAKGDLDAHPFGTELDVYSDE